MVLLGLCALTTRVADVAHAPEVGTGQKLTNSRVPLSHIGFQRDAHRLTASRSGSTPRVRRLGTGRVAIFMTDPPFSANLFGNPPSTLATDIRCRLANFMSVANFSPRA